MNQEETARAVEAQAAQRGESPRVGAFKAEMIRNPDGSATDVRAGLEVKGTAAEKPKPMQDVDPHWEEFLDEKAISQISESDAWEVAGQAGEELIMRDALEGLHQAEDD